MNTMKLKNSVWISSKLVFKWTLRKRRCSSLTLSNYINENLNYFKKLKFPECLYVYDNDVAKDISDTICSNLVKMYDNKKITLIEVNPGPCLITQHILKKTNYDMCLYEGNCNAFKEFYEVINTVHGNRININRGNFLLLWKFGFQDRIDRGSRVSTFLSNIGAPQPWNQESPSLKIIAALPNKKFLNYLIYSYMFQTGLMTYGRPEFYFLLPPSLFTKFSSKPIIDEKYYKTQSILFQIIFDLELLKTYPRTAFFPSHLSKSGYKNVRFKEIKKADDEFIILAKVVGRRNILETGGLTEDLLKPFWYFVKHHTLSRKNFVIPMLEQWIPGCGPHFIAQGYTIFTQFGDLTPLQILDIFLNFISLPEFNDSTFLSSMESRITKLLPSLQITSNNSNVEEPNCNSPLEFLEFHNKDD